MYEVNRSVFLLIPLDPFWNWLKSLPGNHLDGLTLEDIQADANSYLVRPCETADEVWDEIEARFEDIFAAELADWCEDESEWPDLDADSFQRMVRHPTLHRDYRPRTRTHRTRRVPTHQSQLMKLTVRNYHLDGYGHVNNARYLEFLEEARWTFFQEHDLLSELKGIMLVVARVDIRYRRPSLEGDVLTFTGRLKDIGTRHIILSQTATLPNGKAAIEAEVTLMPVSSESGRSISVPQTLAHAIQNLTS